MTEGEEFFFQTNPANDHDHVFGEIQIILMDSNQVQLSHLFRDDLDFATDLANKNNNNRSWLLIELVTR